VGAAAGAAASQPRVEERVIVEQPAAPISERTCTTDAAGNRVCTEVRR
jgi:hypothetical protein